MNARGRNKSWKKPQEEDRSFSQDGWTYSRCSVFGFGQS